jgi:flagellar assembly protein FliH
MKTIIRPGQTTARNVAFNFDDMAEKAKAYLASVQAEAQKIIDDARRQAEAIRQRAQEEGRAAALAQMDQAAEQKMAAQIKTLLPALQQAIRRIDESRSGWLKHWERQAVRLAAAIAKRIVRQELARDPDIPLRLVHEALELSAGSTDIRIHLNPDDHHALGTQARLLVAELNRAGTAEVLADPAITPGGCRLETKFGVIDQQIETQLARIEEELT